MGTYLVTGAAGFIGNHLALHLADRGEHVIGVDTGLHANAELQYNRLTKAGVEVLKADLTDTAQIAALPAVDGVYHLAALNGTQNFYSRPFATAWHSTVPTMNLLRHYGERGTGFFFYAGSSESYATTVTKFGWEVPTGEDVALSISDSRELRWSYGASKTHGEVACFAAQAEYGMPVAVGRFHNAYGPNMGVHHVIPDFVERGKQGIFELYGAEHTRSFIYIDDAVQGVLAVANQAHGEIVNIGSPIEVSMRDLGATIMKIAGWEGEIIEHDGPSASVLRRAPKIDRLAELIDTTKFISLADGIRRTLPSYLDGADLT